MPNFCRPCHRATNGPTVEDVDAVKAPAERTRRSREDKHEERRVQLAQSALATLGELGYARTSLREIAQKSPFSHGVVHYYFADKTALILHCVRYYKTQCMTRYDEVVATATTPEELLEGFTDRLVETLCQEAAMHRLWYDLRNQSMFEPTLREDVIAIDEGLRDMVDRVVVRYCELSGGRPRNDAATTYALFDGIFLNCLTAHTFETVGSPEDGEISVAAKELRTRATALLPGLVSLD